MTATPTEKYRSTEEVIAWLAERGLRLRPQTLINWRHVGGGPPFHRFGHRVVYAERGLTNWVEARLGAPLSSTSDQPSTLEKSSALCRGSRLAKRSPAFAVGETNRAAAEHGATVGTRPQLKRSP